MGALTLDTRLDAAVGDAVAAALTRAFGHETVRDLLWHVPRRYSNRGELTPLAGLPVGEHVTVLAQVLDVRERPMQRRGGSLLEARITDGDGSLQLTFFNQKWRARELRAGVRGIFSGKVSVYRDRLQLQHPDYELFADGDAALDPGTEAVLDEAAAKAFAEQPVPIYPASAQVPSWNIQKTIARVLDALGDIDDPLPDELRASERVLDLRRAFELVHRPRRASDWPDARRSLVFREAFELQLSLLDRRRRLATVDSAPRAVVADGALDEFDRALPFELTADQAAAAAEISRELAEPHPMHRLLQGEVGSGKTVVALRAMLQVADAGGQSALLAPTEVLAAQHTRSIVEALGPALAERLRPTLLTSKMPAAQKRKALLAIASGSAAIVIGTHALISDHVSLYDLGLIVIDEQHRFGVEQREALRLKGTEPHVLAMTATPIPRTVALTAFGDLEVSTIRTLPAGRRGIESFSVPVTEKPGWVERAWVRALEEIAQGRQVYVVCPAITASTREEGADELEPDAGSAASSASSAPAAPIASVEGTLEWLRARSDYSAIRMAPLTGAMRPDEKDETMRAFAAGEIDLLVATTVIEVGVNVPNASVMIVRDAERFGVSQLHQLRGRVGRGEHPGLCLMLTNAPQGSIARERVDTVAAVHDGFELAERDLDLRREGDILGSAQSGGRSSLRLLRVSQHGELIVRTRELATQLLERDPQLRTAPALAEMLRRESQQQRLDNLAKS